ncbi:MAG: M20/M25/M40 family metallo-hydrolase [Candidatus Melainabacteria bacterium]|nr:M20/M25/M40 family metallo-hydrolase [Candidatus Melainabacteria bacterium]
MNIQKRNQNYELAGKKLIQPEALLQRLVQIPSYSSVEEIQMLVVELMHNIGLEVQTCLSESVIGNGLTNVVGKLSGKLPDCSKSLMLVAHADTVPLEPLDRWQHEPLSGMIEDGRIYGRGVMDDKAGIVLMLAVAEALIREGVSLGGDLILVSAADDESSGDGFRKLFINGIKPDACLMLDGAKLHQIGYAHAGCLWYRMHVVGSTTACNNKAANAVEKTILILNKLFQMASSFNQRVQDPYTCFENPVRLNVCKIEGGEWLGNNAASCITEFSMNFIQPEKLETIRRSIAEVISACVQSDDWLINHPPTLEPVYMAFDPYESPLKSSFFKTIERAHVKVTGRVLEPRSITGWFHGAAFECPCFLYGPGNGGAAHGIDEYFELSSFETMIPAIVEITKQWCNSNDGVIC